MKIEAGYTHGLTFGPDVCASCDARTWTDPDMSEIESTVAALRRLAQNPALVDWAVDVAIWATTLEHLE